MKRIFRFVLLVALAVSCRSFEDARPTERISLVHFYGGTQNYEGIKAVPDADGGFVIIGNIRKNDFTSDIVVLKTDARGETLWQKIVPSGTASDIIVVDDGYLIAGDSIEYQPNPDRISELVNTRARLFKMLFNQTITSDLTIDDSVNVGSQANPVYSHIDFHGNAITIDDLGEVVLLGSYKTPLVGSLTKSVVFGTNPSTLNIVWRQEQSFLDARDYTNTRSLLLSPSNNLLWAATSQQSSISLTTGWLTIVYVGVGSTSTFKNNDKLGENAADHFYTGSDMARSGFGYGVVGTFARVDNTSSNIYFTTVDDRGNITGTPKYYDGIDLELSDATASSSEDTGNAIVGTNDGGYVIGGSMESTPGNGNGGKDIVLIKVDAFGGFQWSKRHGGSGDDVVRSIRETSDGGLLVCGTNTVPAVNGLSSIFVMKTNKDGELRN